MNKIPNRKVICDVLMEHAAEDRDIVVLCSDSRGSASLAPFFEAYPDQAVEVGIAEQDLVGIAAGLAKCGKKSYAASPASFVSTRSYEQAKVDCAYSDTNVKLIGISGGVSYGALGMSHHSAQDIAAMSAIPNMRVYLPSDRHQTRHLIEALLQDEKCAYIRVGRNPVEDVYTEEDCPFEMNHATVVWGSLDDTEVSPTAGSEENEPAGASGCADGRTAGSAGVDVVLIGCGEMVLYCKEAAELLEQEGITSIVLDMYCVKPLDEASVVKAARRAKLVVSVEEHAPYGGLGSRVAQVVGAQCPRRVLGLALPDAPVITGTSKEVFEYYGLTAEGIAKTVREALL